MLPFSATPPRRKPIGAKGTQSAREDPQCETNPICPRKPAVRNEPNFAIRPCTYGTWHSGSGSLGPPMASGGRPAGRDTSRSLAALGPFDPDANQASRQAFGVRYSPSPVPAPKMTVRAFFHSSWADKRLMMNCPRITVPVYGLRCQSRCTSGLWLAREGTPGSQSGVIPMYIGTALHIAAGRSRSRSEFGIGIPCCYSFYKRRYGPKSQKMGKQYAGFFEKT